MSGHHDISSARASPRLRTNGSSAEPISSATGWAAGLAGCDIVDRSPREYANPAGVHHIAGRPPNYPQQVLESPLPRIPQEASAVPRQLPSPDAEARPADLLSWYERHARV